MGAKDIIIIGLVAVIVGLVTYKSMPRWVVPSPLLQTESTPAKTKSVLSEPAPDNQKDCEAALGKWEGGVCNLPTSDAGKPCTDRSQCESFCWAGEGFEAYSKTSGTCYPWRYFSDCISSVNNGRTTGICVGGVHFIKVTIPPQK